MAERTVFQSMSQKHVLSLGPSASVWEAACVMTRANCGSVLIMEPPDTLLGIVTERDLMTRVLAKALDPEKTHRARGDDAQSRVRAARDAACRTPCSS